MKIYLKINKAKLELFGSETIWAGLQTQIRKPNFTHKRKQKQKKKKEEKRK